jgi:hypothetical protein
LLFFYDTPCNASMSNQPLSARRMASLKKALKPFSATD